MDTLNALAIARAAGPPAGSLGIEVVDECASTNALLLARPCAGRPVLLAAEVQSAGRGRRGRRWHSPRGAGLTLSLAQRMRGPLAALSGLSLAAGVAVAGELRRLGATEVALKWPNDLVARGAKLGGILVETRADGDGVLAVIGVGINLRAAPALAAKLRREIIALQSLLQPLPSRNRLAGRIAASLLDTLEAFEAGGLEALRAGWEMLHANAGERVRLRLAGGHVLSGIAAGIACDGALRLRTRGGLRDIHAAQIVNARPARRAARLPA